MRILTEGIRTSDVHRIFGNVSFICFNYDRCIEHYFFYALQNYYGIKAEEAQQIMRSVPIVHPYGRVGPLPWEPSGGVSFGAKLTAPGLLEVTQQIRTFTEEARDENLGLEIQRLIDQAEVIVFLGCAYHSLNLQILKSPKERQSTEI